ncbi:MAG: alpha/beta hydrolase-fold protein [Flavobacteriaceae bacterium]|nr:alpha/beta hydrolase-fold protein [Flavobacteriaceae bacterium]
MPQIVYTDYYSHILGRSLKVEVTGHWGYPILMFPTTKGQFIQNRDFGLNDSVQWFTNNGLIKLYNIETLDAENIYNKSIHPNERVWRYHLYHQFLTQEYVPYLQRENNTHTIATAGCSFGGYHAANFGFRNPGIVSHIFSMSGAFSIRDFVKGGDSDLIFFHSPDEFMRNEQSWRYNHLWVILGTTDRDALRPDNRQMADILSERRIKHWYDEKKWANHDWPIWLKMFPEYLGKFF